MQTPHSSSFATRNAQEEGKEEDEEEERRRRGRLQGGVRVAEEMSAARVRARHELIYSMDNIINDCDKTNTLIH